MVCSFVSGFVSRLLKPPIETVATIKLLAGMVAYPATYLAWVFLAGRLAGPLAAGTTALVLPVLGFVALAWIHRRQEVWEDVKLFFRVIRRPRLRERLAERRAALAAELDALGAEWSEALAERRRLERSSGGETPR